MHHILYIFYLKVYLTIKVHFCFWLVIIDIITVIISIIVVYCIMYAIDPEFTRGSDNWWSIAWIYIFLVIFKVLNYCFTSTESSFLSKIKMMN
jgi:hypothetical protein